MALRFFVAQTLLGAPPSPGCGVVDLNDGLMAILVECWKGFVILNG